MAYAAGTMRFIIKGTLYGVQDWSVGISAAMGGSTEYSYSVLQTFLTASTTPFVNWFNAIGTLRSTQTTFTTLRLEQYTGATDAATINETAVTGTSPGGSAAVHPAYATLCLGTLTGRPGGSYKGRMYVPALAAPVDNLTGYTNSSVQTALRTATVTLLQAINGFTIAGSGMTASVASRTTGSSAPITSVRTDQVLDVQRRRNNDFTRVYTSSNV